MILSAVEAVYIVPHLTVSMVTVQYSPNHTAMAVKHSMERGTLLVPYVFG